VVAAALLVGDGLIVRVDARAAARVALGVTLGTTGVGLVAGSGLGEGSGVTGMLVGFIVSDKVGAAVTLAGGAADPAEVGGPWMER
jgi:hypothetical protein